jgi:protein ImuB
MAAVRRLACLFVGERTPGRVPSEERDLLEVALDHSPRVEEGGPGVVYLDIAGLCGLFGDEAEIGRRLARGVADRGVRVQVGIAGSRISALIAARRKSGVAVIAPGEDAEQLASAKVSLLDLTAEMTARLGRWGIRTLGELAELPAPALFERLGSEGLKLQRLARGEDPRPLRPWAPPPVFEESIEPEWAVESLGPLGDLLTGLVERVCSQLERRGLSADQFEWICRLSGGAVHEGSVAPAVAMNEPASVATLLKASLESRPPRGAVEGITLRARPVRVAAAQESLTDRSRPSPRMLAATLARLAALVGVRQVGIPVVLDTHAPDAVKLDPTSPREETERAPHSPLSSLGRGQGEGAHGEGRHGEGALALRRLRPPLPARVTLTAGRPAHVHSDRLTAAIVASAGPWRSSGEWWTERPWIHDEWDVELGDGTLCRLANDGSAWSVEGIYD